MTPDCEGVHAIANTSNLARKADIVFVHGVGGSSHATWQRGKEGREDYFLWPEELGKDLTDCGVWSVGYPAGFTGLGKQGMIIEKRAGNVSDKLVNAGLGGRPIVFITHSMGGLIVKHLIVDSQMLPGDDRKRIVGWIRGIVFCGTPHRGSGFADAAHVFGILGGGSQAHVDEMCANAEKLDLLQDKFIEWHRHHPVPIVSYAENQKLLLTRWLFFPTDYGIVVPRASANPGIPGCEIHDSDDDHLTLVKPRNRQHDVYAGVLRFLRESHETTVQIPEAKVSLARSTLESFRSDTERIEKLASSIVGDCFDEHQGDLLRTLVWKTCESMVGGGVPFKRGMPSSLQALQIVIGGICEVEKTLIDRHLSFLVSSYGGLTDTLQSHRPAEPPGLVTRNGSSHGAVSVALGAATAFLKEHESTHKSKLIVGAVMGKMATQGVLPRTA